MDTLATLPAPIKRRRHHSQSFKAQILAETQQPDASIAAVALRHNLNPNLVQKWRRIAKQTEPTEFVRIAPVPAPAHSATVLVEVPVGNDHVRVDWPLDQMIDCAQWLKPLRG